MQILRPMNEASTILLRLWVDSIINPSKGLKEIWKKWVHVNNQTIQNGEPLKRKWKLALLANISLPQTEREEILNFRKLLKEVMYWGQEALFADESFISPLSMEKEHGVTGEKVLSKRNMWDSSMSCGYNLDISAKKIAFFSWSWLIYLPYKKECYSMQG